jgi:hypothetical protein
LLNNKNMSPSNICPRCSNHVETIFHCLQDCDVAKSIWHSLGFRDSNFFNNMIIDDLVA